MQINECFQGILESKLLRRKEFNYSREELSVAFPETFIDLQVLIDYFKEYVFLMGGYVNNGFSAPD